MRDGAEFYKIIRIAESLHRVKHRYMVILVGKLVHVMN